MMSSKLISVIGAGSWGTALAIHLARNGHRVRLQGRTQEKMQLMHEARCNQQYLPDVKFPDHLEVCSDLNLALQDAQFALLCVPSHAFRETLLAISKLKTRPAKIVFATKGLDPDSHQLLETLVTTSLGEKTSVAVLSGPSFAREVADDIPTAVTIASRNIEYAKECQGYFHNQHFRVYISQDMTGVQIAGALKNVLAIAVGIADGLGLGANTRSALITRGLAEMTRLGLAMGAKPETFVGLAGVGDLLLTCTDDQSRNRRFGLALGSGQTKEQALKDIGQVVEGLHNASQVLTLSRQVDVELPICEQVRHLINGDVTPGAAVKNLLSRDPKSETI